MCVPWCLSIDANALLFVYIYVYGEAWSSFIRNDLNVPETLPAGSGEKNAILYATWLRFRAVQSAQTIIVNKLHATVVHIATKYPV